MERKSVKKVNHDQLGRIIYENRHFDAFCGGVKHKLLDDSDPQFKAAILRVSPCVVTVVSLDVPSEMARHDHLEIKETPNQVFIGQGTIIECEKNAGDDKFSTTILTSASLFIRTNGVQPYDIEVDVYLAKGAICSGKVLSCDFHYNLALVTIQMDTPVQPALLRDLDDIMSINVTEQGRSGGSQSFQLRRHSSLFKIRPGDKVASLNRSAGDFVLSASLGQFSACYPGLDCKELYSISSSDPEFEGICGCPIINCNGEVIGIFAAAMTFLPSNIVSRWWNYYKNFKKYCRPWLGLDVANMHLAELNFLESLLRTFPNISSGIIVTKVVKKSAAHISGLCKEDVIVQCNGAKVHSTLDFFDKIWDKVGEPVELSILRKAEQVNVKVTVGEATPVNFYRWPIPYWEPNPRFRFRDSDSEMPESSHAKWFI